MKSKILFVIVTTILFTLAYNLTSCSTPKYLPKEETENKLFIKPVIVETEIDTLIRAMQWMESRNNPKAKSKSSSATGILQILKITVREANRISDKKFTMDDRLDSLKSVQMFKIIQAHYNPTLDKKKAIYLWRWGCSKMNKKSEDKYFRGVMAKYQELRKEIKIIEPQIIKQDEYICNIDNTFVSKDGIVNIRNNSIDNVITCSNIRINNHICFQTTAAFIRRNKIKIC